MAELDALNAVLQDQLDKAMDAESVSIKELRRELGRTDNEVQRLREKIADSDIKEATQATRIKEQERELLRYQDLGSHSRVYMIYS